MMDYFSKYVEAVPIKDKSAVSVARGIYEVYYRQGAPIHISDQRKEFVNQVAKYIPYSVKLWWGKLWQIECHLPIFYPTKLN